MSHTEERHYLSALFQPASVALIGASDDAGSVGAVLAENLTASYRGALFLVNPRHRKVRGVDCHREIGTIPQRIDLAVIATPASTVPRVIEQCGEAGVRAAVVVTAGFSETGPAGARLERALLENARRHRLRVVGPNCLGLMRPEIGLDATFARGGAQPGSIGLISQSGAVCTAMLDWARTNGVGFSSVVSLGGSTDVDFGEIIDFLVNDPKTEHILLYIEGVRDARRFVSALRAAARVKPVILMKVGRHAAGSRAAMSHTGSIVGADDVFDAVVRRAGAVRVNTVGQIFAAARAFATHLWPRGDRLAVITNGGGPGVMAADRATDCGIPLAELSPQTIEALKGGLPANWSHSNPIDLIGDADAARYGLATKACLADANVDAVLVILTPQAMTDPAAAARAVIEASRGSTKPVLSCWMGEAQVDTARRLLAEAQVPVFRNPEGAVELFAHVATFYRNQRMLLRTPGPLSPQEPPDLEGARAIVESALAEHREVLNEMESKALLAAFRIPIAKTMVAHSPTEALLIAQELGYPVAMKVDSPDITHKSDAGGVRLNLGNAHSVRAAYHEILEAVGAARPDAKVSGVAVESMIVRPNGRELMIGVIRDPVFGPAITFGSGGTTVEVHRDRAVALPPLDEFLVGDLICSTRVSKLLGAFRHMPPVDRAALENALLRVSEMICELPWLTEMDINPMIVDEHGAIAADARIVVRRPAPGRGRYGHMAIHPYPVKFVRTWQLPDGRVVTLRPIRPEDAKIEHEFVRDLSDESRYFRFMNTLRELTPMMLARFTQIDYDREMAFIAVIEEGAREIEIGVVRYIANPDGETCEFALVVADAWHRHGLGRRLMELLIEVARARGLQAMLGHILANNQRMLELCSNIGFVISESPGEPTLRRALLRLAT